MKNLNILFAILTMLIISSCGESIPKKDKKATIDARDLDEIKEDGKLKALITYSGTSYFLYRGHTMGYEYELLKRLADHLDVELDIYIAKDIDQLLSTLKKGEVDIVAHGLTITQSRKKQVAFTDYLYLVHQVLVQKKPDEWRQMRWADIQKTLIHDPIELINDTISVREKTAYLQRINNLSKEMGGQIYIDTLKGNLSTDEIIKMVVDGKIKYTIADNNLANINASYYPVLKVDVPVSFSQKIAWAVNPESEKLLEATNKWIRKERKGSDYYVIYNKYFKNKQDFRKRIKSDFYSLNNNQISQYDQLLKKNADRINWDWRLLASLVYQESKFDPSAQSWAGAKGLMQMMPATAKEMGVKNINDPNESIKGGAKYLKQIFDNFIHIQDSVQRIKFTLASYNCGYYHVLDAQTLAEKENLNPNKWDDHVEKMILALSYPKNYNKESVKYGYVRGIEPYKYVRQIFERYNHYTKFIK